MRVEARQLSPIATCPDHELIARTRAGESEAFGELYRRHEAAALGRARQLVRSTSDSEDVVAEAFARILDLLQRGGGPETDFRPYLLTCVRHGCADRARGAKTIAVDPSTMVDSADLSPSEFTDGVETKMVLREAFANVPLRWQQILWHTEVEDRSLDDLAEEMALTPTALASLSYRARKALGAAYLGTHRPSTLRPRCEEVLGQVGGYIRQTLGRRARKRVDAHLSSCSGCQTVADELDELDRTWRA